MPRPSFHKVILTTTLQSKQLRVPDNFLRKYGGELSSFVNLSVPDGSSWRVGLKKVDNKFWFIDGWAEFVQRYSIGVGYLLAFRYEGKSNFSVHIFNLATAEINYQSPTRSSNEGSYFANRLKIFEEMEDEDFTESKPALQNLFNGSKLNSVNWGEGGNALPAKSARDIGLQFNAIEFKKSTDELKLRASFEEKAKKTARKKRKSEPGSAEGQEASDGQEEEREMRIRFYESASARKRTVTAEEREKAVNEAKAFEPSNPFCRVVLRPSYLYRGCIMYLPSCFAEKYLNGVSGFIKLQHPDGRQWPVRCLYRTGRAKLSQGWFEFAIDNNLGEGDVCVFELLRMKEVVLQVTIFRVTDEAEFLSPPPLLLTQNVNQAKLLRSPMQQHHLTSPKG
ncbi:hypothetical protein HN51_034255 [Arachis hypogaea]|uniref:TF-B3 domain-containing protein n=1 Tax=Arachis hypogaea TaxID=3818 RepID=A0A445A994_ARAHY|nr:B3 domain-containing transcription factor VRN1 isoform X1 [Arachis hypogaea]QHN99091.1 B3 domain-containing transcription factor [Arachis hypogaea]RYR22892.1 hypothetical protein Ahy_B03g068179 isoform B [Arachis hypogaea]